MIDDFLPIISLDVKWSKKTYASLGNTLKPEKLQDTPSISLGGPGGATDICVSGQSPQFVITLTDPDAPSRDDPKWSEMCHWIASGKFAASGECSEATLAQLHDVMPYKPPGPPEKTGKHRYVFLVFAPANGTSDELHLSKPSDRQHWGGDEEGHGVRDWAKENGLVPVGELTQGWMRIHSSLTECVAANFIYAQKKKQ